MNFIQALKKSKPGQRLRCKSWPKGLHLERNYDDEGIEGWVDIKDIINGIWTIK